MARSRWCDGREPYKAALRSWHIDKQSCKNGQKVLRPINNNVLENVYAFGQQIPIARAAFTSLYHIYGWLIASPAIRSPCFIIYPCATHWPTHARHRYSTHMMAPDKSCISRIIDGFNSRCENIITRYENRDAAISSEYNMLLAKLHII